MQSMRRYWLTIAVGRSRVRCALVGDWVELMGDQAGGCFAREPSDSQIDGDGGLAAKIRQLKRARSWRQSRRERMVCQSERVVFAVSARAARPCRFVIG